ncbi:TetR/AcrR family transcriptional regulator [Lacrimispora sp. NSJ-141]|uniref:TetR/AcrR family transcriptional regulator n=1 Tax=Lientehia hominis TaxID=2897778 RepID=A0AAP2RG04_9FIRM|nr:TetR/AcrR family transcriptional regulator [Lientehia hominis]MCD2491534.1 TetR/AcrR family transcriptional regulator [Lientehia hominis]
MNKCESKYFNTALCMDEALIALLEVKDLQYITIKEICEKAGVNRSTFYLHYETIADLVNEAMESVDTRFQSYFAQDTKTIWDKINGDELKDLVLITGDYLKPYLQFISDNKKVYRAAFRNPNSMQANERYGNLKKYVLQPILKKFKVPSAFWKYYIAYYIEGIMAIIKEWLNHDCSDTVETIAAIIEECVRPTNGTIESTYGE